MPPERSSETIPNRRRSKWVSDENAETTLTGIKPADERVLLRPIRCPFAPTVVPSVTNVATEESLKDTLVPKRNIQVVGDGSLMKNSGNTIKQLSLDEKLSQAKQFLREFYNENLK